MCLKGVEGNLLHTVFGRVLRSVPYECLTAYRALSVTETLHNGPSKWFQCYWPQSSQCLGRSLTYSVFLVPDTHRVECAIVRQIFLMNTCEVPPNGQQSCPTLQIERAQEPANSVPGTFTWA